MSDLNKGNLIEKSKALVWARFRDYTAGELRLLEVYLSRINPRNPESANVKFTLSEYCRFLGLPALDVRNIKPQLKHFLGNVVSIKVSDDEEYNMYTLFTRAEIRKDKDIGQYVISINCNPELRNVFFSLAEDGYIRYRLRYTASMKSQYSILLYSLLRDMSHIRGGWDISLDRLKEQLGANDKSYSVYKDFRRRVLDPAVNEINKVSDLQVSYEKITTGRKVTGIHFKSHVKPSKKKDNEPADNKSVAAQNGPVHDGHWFAEATSGYLSDDSAAKMAEMIIRKIREYYPEIPKEQWDSAAKDTLHAAYMDIVENSSTPEIKTGAKIYSTLNKGKAIENYIPASYVFPELYQNRKF